MTARKEDMNQPAPAQKDQVPDDPGGLKAYQQVGHGAKASEHGTPLPEHAAAQTRALQGEGDTGQKLDRDERRERRAQDAEARNVIEEAERIQESPSDKPKAGEQAYVVSSGTIAPLGNSAQAKREHGERARLYVMGETVMLTPALARMYVKKRLLDPYIPDDDE